EYRYLLATVGRRVYCQQDLSGFDQIVVQMRQRRYRLLEAARQAENRVSLARPPQHQQSHLSGSMGIESVEFSMPRSRLVSHSDSRETTPFNTSGGANLNCRRVISALPPPPFLISLHPPRVRPRPGWLRPRQAPDPGPETTHRVRKTS